MMDFGYPQVTEFEMLKQYVTSEGVKSDAAIVSFFLCLEREFI